MNPFNHYRITIQDINRLDVYECIWSTYSMQEMAKRYKAAVGKTIIAEIHIFQSEPECEREVVLRDFLVLETAESTEKTDDNKNPNPIVESEPESSTGSPPNNIIKETP